MSRRRKIIVFGGAGFLGSYVVDALSDAGNDVTVFDRMPARSDGVPVQSVIGDILDADAVRQAVEGFDIVYHFAGQADIGRSIVDPTETIRTNVLGTVNVLEACRRADVQRFIFASTVYVFSENGGFYGISKNACERLIEEYGRQFGLEYTIVRYGSVYGERAGESNRIHRILSQALREGRIDFPGDGTEEREYIHALDAAKLSVQLLDRAYAGQHVILTGVERYRYDALLNLIREILGGKIAIAYEGKEYPGHYKMTPYSFTPSLGRKLVANPSIDLGQGLLKCIETVYRDLART